MKSAFLTIALLPWATAFGIGDEEPDIGFSFTSKEALAARAEWNRGTNADTILLLDDADATGLGGRCKPMPEVPDGDTVIYGSQVRCQSQTYDQPSTWLKTVGAGDEYVYDLAIIGAGVASGYLANELLKEMPDARIAVFEASQRMGGRLMSAYGSGALGQGVQDSSLEGSPPQEYGGMRIDPINHWLVWDAIEEVAERTFPGKPCRRKGGKQVAPIDPMLEDKFSEEDRTMGTSGECDNYMIQMTTATMRYALAADADNKTFGEFLKKSSFDDDGVILNTCLSLIGFTQDYAKDNMSPEEMSTQTLDQAVNDACENCDKVSQELCDTCKLFPNPGMNLISCIGYDDLSQVPAQNSLLDAAAVTGQGDFNCQKDKGPTDNCANLFLFKHGAQRFAMDLLNTANAGPYFRKTLQAIEIDGQDVEALAKEQAAKSQGATENVKSESPKEKQAPMALKFGDGSVARTKAVYLTVLPMDLVALDGMQPWIEPLKEATLPFGATKLFIHWDGGMPEEIKKATQEGGIRLVTDGNRPGQMPRQIFYWDPDTILVYQTAPIDNDLPANQMQDAMQTKGMDQMIGVVMEELMGAFGVEFPYPTWGRVKAWPVGGLSYYRSGCGTRECAAPVNFQQILQRPLGQEVPVFYGNSEMSGGGGSTQGTGWVMGSFQQVQLHLDAIVEYLKK
jgi:hypothetical protein